MKKKVEPGTHKEKREQRKSSFEKGKMKKKYDGKWEKRKRNEEIHYVLCFIIRFQLSPLFFISSCFLMFFYLFREPVFFWGVQTEGIAYGVCIEFLFFSFPSFYLFYSSHAGALTYEFLRQSVFISLQFSSSSSFQFSTSGLEGGGGKGDIWVMDGGELGMCRWMGG